MKNKIYQAFLVFVLVFCTPWAIANALTTYKSVGQYLGKLTYDSTHKDNI